MNTTTQRQALLTLASVALLIMAAGAPLHAQTWEMHYGNVNYRDSGYCVIPIRNSPLGAGGFVALGTRESVSPTDTTDIYVVRVDNNGTVLWEKTYNVFGLQLSDDRGLRIIECSNGDLAIVGTTQDPLNTYNNRTYMENILLMRLSYDGNQRWSHTYGGLNADMGLSVIESTVGEEDNDLIVAGSTYSFGAGLTENGGGDANLAKYRDGFLLRVASDGTFKWSRTYGGAEEDYFTCLQETSDGSLIMAGGSRSSPGNTTLRPFLVKTNAVGTVTFSYTYSVLDQTTQADLPTDINGLDQCTYDGSATGGPYNVGNIIMVGTCNARAVNPELFLLQVDVNGIVVSSRSFGDETGTSGSTLEDGHDVIELSDGNLLAVGRYYQSAGQGYEAFAVKADNTTTNAMGQIWSRAYGSSQDDRAWSVIEVDNSGTWGASGFVIAGTFAAPPASTDTWLYLIKTDAAGITTGTKSSCSETPANTQSVPASTAITTTLRSMMVRTECSPVVDVRSVSNPAENGCP